MKIITFGELLIRLSPPLNKRFLQTNSFEVSFAGSEANVAADLACLGSNAAFISALPEHDIGQMAVNSLRMLGVDTSEIVRKGARIGILYLEKGASQRPSKVLYDREASSLACASVKDFDFEKIFAEAGWFHFSGITPALSESAAEVCIEACKIAKSKGLTISCDINYRRKLWTKAKASQVMRKLMAYVDICIANEEDCADVFGIAAHNTEIGKGCINNIGYIDVARQMTKEFNLKYIAITLRESKSASDNSWSGMLYAQDQAYFSHKYDIHIVDRIGAGDSFAAGLIFALQNGFECQKAIEFATALSCLKHTIEGDYSFTNAEEVMKLVDGDRSGRVQR